MKTKTIALVLSLMFTAVYSFADSSVTYSNTDFNSAAPGWSNTLTINNNRNSEITIKKIQFKTTNAGLKASNLNGTLVHNSEFDSVKTENGVTTYILVTQSQWGTKDYAKIAAAGYANLSGIAITHNSTIVDGVPDYYSLPTDVILTLEDDSTVTAVLKGRSTDPDPAPGKIAGAYFTNWANYHYKGNDELMLYPNQIPLGSLNTIYYMVGKIDPATADLSFSDINHDQYYIPVFATLRQQYPYLNVFYSFGGWGSSNNYPSYDLAAIFDKKDDKLLDTLASNMVKLMQKVGFNGIDIDYEWTAISPSGDMVLTPDRALGYQKLIIKLRQKMDETTKITGEKYYVTSAVFAGVDQIKEFEDKGGSWKTVSKNLDALDLMTYDYHGQFDAAQTENGPDNITGFLSGMKTGHKYNNPILDKFNVEDSVKRFLDSGVSADKIVVGIPAYTRIEKVAADSPITDKNKGYYMPLALSADQPKGAGNQDGGSYDYKAIVNSKYLWGKPALPEDMIYVQTNMTGSGMGSEEMTPWIYSKADNIFGSFDDGVSAKHKGQWIKEQGLGGFMVWEIDGDIPQTDGSFKEKSVIYNACEAMTAGDSKQKTTEI